jgi:hypothetical protein
MAREGISGRLDKALENPEISAPAGSAINKDGIEITVKVGKSEGERNNVAGVINNINYGGTIDPIIKPLAPESISEMRDVFAPPDGYEELVKDLVCRKPCVIAVYGPKHCGRLTCAVNVAHRLWGQGGNSPEMFRYKRVMDEIAPLSQIIASKNVKPGTILILEEVFASNVSRQELEYPDVSELEKSLSDKKCGLLLTMETEEVTFLSVASINSKVEEQWRVLESHLSYLEKQGKWPPGKNLRNEVESRRAWLEQGLRNPSKIARFCRWIIEQYRRSPRDIGEIIEEFNTADRRALKEWFDGLCKNEKLLAMLTYLLGGSERQLLEEFYRKSVYGLRTSGFDWLDDPRRQGFGDMVASIEARDLGGWIEFKDAEFEEEVEVQVKSWAHLLWSVLEPLVKDVGPGEEWSPWQPRRALGNALGRMSVYGRRSFGQALQHLAGMGSMKAAMVAGYALEESVRRNSDSQKRPALETLLSWIDSGNPPLMLAAGASLAQVYSATVDQPGGREGGEVFQESLIVLLRRLVVMSAKFNEEVLSDLRSKARKEREKVPAEKRAEIDDKKAVEDSVKRKAWALGCASRKCAWRSAQRIFTLDSQRSRFLGRWLQEDNEFLVEVAREALMLIFGSLTKPRYKPGEAKHWPFLDLVEPVLAAAGKGKHDRLLVEQVFLAVKSWLRWPSWRGPIFQALLDVANRGSSDVRAKLRSALSRFWLHRGSNEESEQAFQIAQAVIARAYAMDGTLMDRPRFGRCVFVLDPTFLSGDEEGRDRKEKEDEERAKEARDRKEKVYRHLTGLLEAQVDVSVVHLGASDAVQLKDQNALPLALDHSVPPLVMPALEAAWTADTRLVFVLTARGLWDLEDVAGQPWAKDFFVVAAGDEVGEHEGVQTIPIGKDPKPEEVEKVEKALQARWARALVQAGPWDWWGVLRSFGLGEEIEEGPRPWLGRLVGGLGDIGLATGHGDLARRILCIFGWYASRDLRACAQLLRSWLLERPLEDGALPFQQWMGAAGARALFAIHSAETPSPEDSAPEILFEELAAPLAAQNRDGSEAVLRAVRQWIEEPLWAWYLAGDIVKGRGRLLRWAEQFAPQHAGELRRLLPEVKETAQLRDGWESLAAMIERIRLRAALGAPKELPKLNEGERYALIVLDAASKAGNLDSVASDLFRFLNSRNGHSLKPVIYRLGERQPVWVAGAPPPPSDVLLVPESPRQPRLLGPILMDPISLKNTQLVLVLTTRPLLDAEDWLETEWREHIVFYQPGADGERHPGFAAVPALNGKSMGVAIARFLLRDAEGEVADEDAASAA